MQPLEEMAELAAAKRWKEFHSVRPLPPFTAIEEAADHLAAQSELDSAVEYYRAALDPDATPALLRRISLQFLTVDQEPRGRSPLQWDRDSRGVAALALQHRFEDADRMLEKLKSRPHGGGLGFAGWSGWFEKFGDRLGDGDREGAAWFYQTAIDACVYYSKYATDSADHLAGMQGAADVDRKLQRVRTDPKFRLHLPWLDK